MLRLALRLLALSIILAGIGWLSIAWVLFEVIRVASVACLTLGLLLLLVWYVRTPDPADHQPDAPN